MEEGGRPQAEARLLAEPEAEPRRRTRPGAGEERGAVQVAEPAGGGESDAKGEIPARRQSQGTCEKSPTQGPGPGTEKGQEGLL